MSNIKLAIKPKYPTRGASDRVLYGDGSFVNIVEVNTPEKAQALFDTSYAAIVSGDSYYPIDSNSVEEQYTLVKAGEEPTVEAKADFGIKKIEEFVSSDDVEVKTGVISGDVKANADKKYVVKIAFDTTKAAAEGYQDIKICGEDAAASMEFTYNSADDLKKAIFPITGTLVPANSEETVEVSAALVNKLNPIVEVLTGYEEQTDVVAIDVDGVECSDLVRAFALVSDGGTITVNKPVTVAQKITISGKTINLIANANITFSGKYGFELVDGTFNASGSATITSSGYFVRFANTDSSKYAILSVSGLTLIGGQYAVATVAKDVNSSITCKNCSMEGLYYGLSINGDSKENTINATNCVFYGNDPLASDEPLGVYIAGPGAYSFTGCTMKSINTGIEIRAGVLALTDCQIEGNTEITPSMHAAGSGSTSVAAGIAAAQHTTKKKISITVDNCTVKASAPILEGNPQGTATATEDTTIVVNSGTFLGEVKTIAADTDCTKFLYGGRYSSEPTAIYIADGYKAEQTVSGAYDIVKA